MVNSDKVFLISLFCPEKYIIHCALNAHAIYKHMILLPRSAGRDTVRRGQRWDSFAGVRRLERSPRQDRRQGGDSIEKNLVSVSLLNT